MSKHLLRSFAGGEITPELFGRLDLTKFQTGLALARNMITLPHGPAARRPGLTYINETKDGQNAVRLIPFAFSANQTAVLEFGDLYIRFHVDGGTVLETPRTILSIVGPLVTMVVPHGYSTGDWVYIGTRFYKITFASPTTFTTTGLDGTVATASGLTAARVYTLVSPYAAADLFDLHYAQNSDVITLTHPSYAARELKRLGAASWTLTSLVFAPTLAAPGGVGAVPTVAVVGNPVTSTYGVTTVGSDGVTESLLSFTAGAVNDLSLAGNFNTVSWLAVAGASRYFVYKRRGGSWGYIGQTTGLSVVDDNILPDTTQAPPENIITMNTGAGDYPAATTYHEQRRWFAGTNLQPQVLWATRTGTESNLTSSIPSRDADGLELRLASSQNNQIRHLVPLSDLLVLTQGGEFRVFSEGAPAITPTSVSIKPQGYSGASGVQPVVTSGSVLYVQAQGSRVRELAYGGESANYGYRSVDLSIMAPHRFNGYTVTQLAYSRAPDSLLWAVRNDGTMLGLTYVPDQQVYGWHAHDTDGLFESVCCVAEGNEDVLYVVVNRTVNGRQTRFIERLKSRIFTDAADGYFVDCGLTYDGAPATTVTGLWHLEGEQVDIVADGAVMPRKVVTGGAITLDEPASVIHVGLPFTSDMKTLPLGMEGYQAGGQGTTKNINEVHLRVSHTSVFEVGPSFDLLREYPARTVATPYGSPPTLRTDEVSLKIDPSTWGRDGSVCVRQSQPLPLTVTSMTLDVKTGG
jgi:hypothetical protein